MQNTTGASMGNEMSGFGKDLKDAAEDVSATVTNQFERGVDAARDLGNRASNTIGKATDYFRETDIRAMSDDVAAYVKEHPLHALAGAAVLGFLAGRLLSRE